jgi:hypothetical protein
LANPDHVLFGFTSHAELGLEGVQGFPLEIKLETNCIFPTLLYTFRFWIGLLGKDFRRKND